MKELVYKQDLMHDLCTLDISLGDMRKVENYILNYESEDLRILYDEIIKLQEEIQWYRDEEDRRWEFEMGEDL